MKRYPIGFAFNEEYTQVALIRKNKPEWQNGCLNGIGGKQEEGETPIQTQIREFEEEAGVRHVEWRQFATVHNDNFVLNCFATDSIDLTTIRSMEEEQVGLYNVSEVLHDREKMISNISHG